MEMNDLPEVSHERMIVCECGMSTVNKVVVSDDCLMMKLICDRCIVKACNEVADYEDKSGGADPFRTMGVT